MERPTAHPDHLLQHVALGGFVVGDADGPAQMPDTELGQHLGEGQELFLWKRRGWAASSRPRGRSSRFLSADSPKAPAFIES